MPIKYSSGKLPISGDEHISDNTFKRVGSIVKQVYPVYNYNNMSDIEVGKQVYSKRYDIWEKYYRLPKILIDYTYRSVWQRILYNVLTSIILLFTFWLIAKVFFYIALGEKFLSFSFLRNNK